jgi:hypothetical protein
MRGSFVLALLLLGTVWPLFLYLGLLLLAFDIGLGIKKRQNINYRLMSHYVVPFFVVYGFVSGVRERELYQNSVEEL